ncbi:DUF4163 domain-containing protein [Clostridium sp. Marseille-P2415]|uniref:DUF4163 domain-containing protein n=1 Tax=Clostridium sp. Marseille-P2415 TaxID=1805471 RepID=UPI001F203F1F|nr:DUF4163 domain-containing protein [Clostridium sp. Marseille-P2415]
MFKKTTLLLFVPILPVIFCCSLLQENQNGDIGSSKNIHANLPYLWYTINKILQKKKEGDPTKRNTLIFVFSMGCVLALSGCGHKNYVKIDLSSTHTTAAQESMPAATESTEPVKIQVSEDQDKQDRTGADTAASGVTAAIHTYQEGNVSIQYPAISNLGDQALEEKINNLLKSNALEIQKAYLGNAQKGSLTIESKVISADRKRTTVVYTGLFSADGAAYPTNIFVTNTVDMSQAKDIRLTDYVDPSALAGYILSEDCKLYDASPELTEAFMAMRSDTGPEAYAKMFQQADFPVRTKSKNGTSVFPESFSYEDGGTIIVSIPVPHALGDFVLVKYTPETK